MVTEQAIIAELALGPEADHDKLIPSDILARHAASEPAAFAENAPVLSVVKLVSTHNWRALESALTEHWDRLKSVNILPLVVNHLLLEPVAPETVGLLALLQYEHQHPVDWASINLEALDFARFAALRERSDETTDAGYKLRLDPTFRHPNRTFGPRKPGYLSSRPWLLEFFINAEANHSRRFVDGWWPLVVPALLNFLDTAELPTKLRGVRLVTQLAAKHAEKLRFSGLVPVFEDSVQPCLSFLPPLVDPAQTKLIHRPALTALVELAGVYSVTQPAKYAQRLNFLAREGCIKPFSHANEKVDLHRYFLAELQWFIASVLRSLTAIHLHAIVQLCNQILTDPFVEYSPELISAVCAVIETVIQWAWPRIPTYRYTLMLGLTRANALDTQAFAMLKPTPHERDTLRALVP